MAEAPAPYLWFDDRGAATHSAALPLERFFGLAVADVDLGRYAVKACGFALLIMEPRRAVLRFNPLAGATAARAAAVRLSLPAAQGAGAPQAVQLEYWQGGWHSEPVRPADAALRIGTILDTAARLAERDAYVSTVLPTQRSALFQEAMSVRRIAMGCLGDVAMRGLARRGLLERTLVVGQEPGGPLVYRYIGWGFTHAGPDWPFEGLGRPTHALFDRRYGERVTRDYVESDGFNSPLAHEVEAEIHEPGGGVRRSRYERVILPWRAPGGQKLFSVTSRLLPAAEGGRREVA